MILSWQDMFTTLGGQAMFLGAAAWVLKSVVTNRLTRDVATFKAQLQASADVEIERLKGSLRLVAIEHQVRFSKLHERRAEVMAELDEQAYRKFLEVQKFVARGMNAPETPEDFNAINRSLFEFSSFIETKRIYLPEDICALLDKLLRTMREHALGVGIYRPVAECRNQIARDQAVDVFRQAYHAIEKEIPDLRKALRKEFRRMLEGSPGVSAPQSDAETAK